MQIRPLLSALFLFGLTVFGLPACTTSVEISEKTPPELPTTDSLPTPAPTGILNYVLAWETDDITMLSNGGWQVTTNLGYEVQLHTGYVTTFRMELIECETEAASGWFPLLPAPVKAGHPSDGPSETRTTQDAVEDLMTLSSQSVASLPVSRADWCTLHYLAGPTTETALNVSGTSETVLGKSILMTGAYKAPNSDTWIDFSATSDEGFGTFMTPPAATSVRLGNGVTSISVSRNAATLFDNIDFANENNSEAIGFAILRQLTGSAAMTVTQ